VAVFAFTAILVMNIIAIVRGNADFGLYTMIFILLLPYALVRWGSGREIVIGMAFIVVGFAAGVAADYTTPGEAVAAMVFATSPALIGATARYRASARRRDREQAVLREREQIARELHDTVAHHVSAIAIQAQVGRTLVDADPGAPLEALAVIEAEASRTLAEMRTIVGALRRGEEPDLAPRLGVADIPRLGKDLVDGPAVLVSSPVDLTGLAPAVDAALYRVAQESITNAIRHGRHPSTVAVQIEDLGARVRMTVHDDGEPTAVQAHPEAGFGLIGMDERTKILGGWCTAGPAQGGGWTVTADLPKDGVGR
jgi:signal transduction histidine kinase